MALTTEVKLKGGIEREVTMNVGMKMQVEVERGSEVEDSVDVTSL